MKLINLILGLWLAAQASAQDMTKSVRRENSVIAHGTIMGFAFGFLFPVGAIVIRSLSVKGLVWVHAAIQSFAVVLAVTGLGLGIYIVTYPHSQMTASNGHPIIGIIVVAALLFQPIGGLVHHRIYKKSGQRTRWVPTHVWWGRIFVTLGVINAGLGLDLSGNTVKGEIAYGVIAGVIWCIWVGTDIWAYFNNRGAIGETGEKVAGSSEASSDGMNANANRSTKSV